MEMRLKNQKVLPIDSKTNLINCTILFLYNKAKVKNVENESSEPTPNMYSH